MAINCNELQLYEFSIQPVIQHNSTSARIRAGVVHEQDAVKGKVPIVMRKKKAQIGGSAEWRGPRVDYANTPAAKEQ